MNRKFAVTSGFVTTCGLVLIAIAVGVSIRTPPAPGSSVTSSDDAQMIKDTASRALRVDAEAAYTFDTSKLPTVYINDPRGGELAPEALAYIQEVRHDPTIRKDQVGMLDYHQAVVERRKREYDGFMADLRAKEANGSISPDEKFTLDGETNGWPPTMPTTPSEVKSAMVTPALPPCGSETATSRPADYPAPDAIASAPSAAAADLASTNAAYPPPAPARATFVTPSYGPTTVPTSGSSRMGVGVVGRGVDLVRLSPKAFEIDLQSIKIEGDVARAVVYQSGVTSEVVLVKVDRQWYLAGAKLLKFAP